MILIYFQTITPRCRYIFRHFFNGILQAEFKLTENVDDYTSHHGPKICYTPKSVGDGLYFESTKLLFEKGIKDQSIEVFERNGEKMFFKTGNDSALPFDPFAAAFYLLSRYEEYLPHQRDEFDRFYARESLASRYGFLEKPVVNIWAEKLRSLILQKYPDVKFKKRKYSFIPTFDIDSAYAYKEKGIMRNLGGYSKSLLKMDMEKIVERSKVLLRKEEDPYDTFEWQLEIIKKYDLKAIYFFLVADYGLNDKNVPINSREFQSLIKSIADYADVGIHPSFGSNEDVEKLKTELRRLSGVLKREIFQSRQHFLKLKLPDTYRNLINLDITDDYTMGYASAVGFRAGTCTPFFFYDLDMEVETKLKLHSFAMMDGTLKDYMHLSGDAAIEKARQLINEVKQVNGELITLWHNHSLEGEKQWSGWKKVFVEIVRMAV